MISVTYQPLLVPLEAVQLELLHGDDHPGAGLGGSEGALVHPPLEHGAEAPLPQQVVRPEVPGGASELTEGEPAEIGGLQDLFLGPRSRRHREGRTLGTEGAAAGMSRITALGIVTWMDGKASAQVTCITKLTLYLQLPYHSGSKLILPSTCLFGQAIYMRLEFCSLLAIH